MSDQVVSMVDCLLAQILADSNLPAALQGMITYHLGWTDTAWNQLPVSRRPMYGGKKMRAVLCARTCEAAGGSVECVIPAATAVELIQNFSLVHDDIEDGDRERRHRPTVWVRWGVPQAINTGSAMQALVNAAVLRSHADAETVLDLFRALTSSMVEMTEGQHLDILFQTSDTISLADYEDMASRKTGALMEAAAYCGARMATADDERLQAWKRFGRAFGEAFQARDDLLGVIGDPVVTGKPVGNDIRVRKKALPLVYAFHNATPEDHEILLACMAEDPVRDESVQCVTSVMERSGALVATRAAVDERTAAALTALHEAHPRRASASRIREMVRTAVGREA